jgi:predicted NUDIX family NTP pyrophosphohydrolase
MTTGKVSAGLMMYRLNNGELEIFLAHPGGPFLKNKDLGYWGIPKGEVENGEELLAAAVREFGEETGLAAAGEFLPLGSVVQASGKTVHAWAFAGDWEDGRTPASNLFPLEWPPKSGKQEWFPEVDKAAFFPVPEAMRKINRAQGEFIVRLQALLGTGR